MIRISLKGDNPVCPTRDSSREFGEFKCPRVTRCILCTDWSLPVMFLSTWWTYFLLSTSDNSCMWCVDAGTLVHYFCKIAWYVKKKKHWPCTESKLRSRVYIKPDCQFLHTYFYHFTIHSHLHENQIRKKKNYCPSKHSKYFSNSKH